MEVSRVDYHMLDEPIYRNSRYELIQLLEDICPTKQSPFKNIRAFDGMVNAYELLIDKYFPAIPFSEERLAIFLRIYSEVGAISQALILAVELDNRAVILSILQQVPVTEAHNKNLKRRRFYESEIFGGK